MNELIGFLTSKEIIVVYIVAAIACALCFIIYLVDKNYYKRKQKHNTKELNKLVEDVNEVIESEYEPAKSVEVFNTPILAPLETSTELYTAKKQEPVLEVEEKIESLEIEQLEPINVEEIVLETMTEEVVEEEPIIIEEKQEELLYTSVEPDRKEAQEELMRLTQELEKAEQETRNIDLTAFEAEQEENAIISLEELVRKSKEMYESNELTQYEDEGNEPISLEDLERRMNQVKEDIATIEKDEPVIIETIEQTPVEITPVVEVKPETPQQLVLDDLNTIQLDKEPVVEEKPIEPIKPAYQTVKKFERSPIISPIYGIERSTSAEDIELENTANYEKLDEEIKKTNEFLMTLRELQKNLD